MGKYILDQYSLLHFATGVIAFFWGISFWTWFFIHLVFEIVENTSIGIHFIDNNLNGIWPGGKLESDTLVNSTSDQVFTMLGWIVAFYLDKKLKNKEINKSLI